MGCQNAFEFGDFLVRRRLPEPDPPGQGRHCHCGFFVGRSAGQANPLLFQSGGLRGLPQAGVDHDLQDAVPGRQFLPSRFVDANSQLPLQFGVYGHDLVGLFLLGGNFRVCSCFLFRLLRIRRLLPGLGLLGNQIHHGMQASCLSHPGFSIRALGYLGFRRQYSNGFT